MKKRLLLTLSAMAAVWCVLGAAPAGVPRDSNNLNTGGYDGTRVEAQLVIPVKESTQAIHFVRDNNDPRVITKTYLLKSVDAYDFRDYLRQMVQSKRVGNTTMLQQYPGNTQAAAAANGQTVTLPPTATISSVGLAAVNAQMGFAPAAQLGSNTAVECLKFADGTGLLIVSAEDYRFKDHPDGMGIDTLVKTLDDPALGDISYGNPMFIYMPKFVPARNLLPLIQNVGMNITDVTEIWQGQDLVAYDPELNWLIFDVENYSSEIVANLLRKYDVPLPQVRLEIAVYELFSENDDKIGLDFQSWKNNQGADLFSVGGRYRNNWSALYDAGGLDRSLGSERTSFYNFNPKWNTRYLDFLTASGQAQILHRGELLIRNASNAVWERKTQLFYIDTSQPVPGTTSPETADYGVGNYKLLESIIEAVTGEVLEHLDPIAVGKGNAQVTAASSGYGFSMEISDLSVNLKETRFKVKLSNSSLIGFQSNGTPRISGGNSIEQIVSLPHGIESFIIGGLTKTERVQSRTGIPYLMDVPFLGWIFSSESTSLKTSRLVVAGSCRWDSAEPNPGEARSIRTIRGLAQQ